MAHTTTQKKAGKRGSKASQVINEAAQLAADEAVAELSQEMDGDFEDDGDLSGPFQQAQAVNAVDVFDEAFKKALNLNDAARFHIKKNSQFLTVKDYPYSWEKLQAEFGPGYYQVIAKRRSNGQLLKMQTEMVGDPNEGREEVVEEVTGPSEQDKNIQMLAYLQSQQERAEARARETSRASENNLGSVLQAITTATQKSTELMMTMMMEQSKQTQTLLMTLMTAQQQPKSDPLIPLLTTLLSKPVDQGLKPLEVFKMVKDAERDARDQANRQNDIIDKRAKELAEAMASGDDGGEEKEESFTKTLIKGFLPVLAQITQNNQQGLQQHIQDGRTQAGGTDGLNQGFVEEGPVRKMIPAAQPQRQTPRPQGQAPQPRPVQAAPQNAPPMHIDPSQLAGTAQPQTKPAPGPQVLKLDARQKEAVFNFASPDIAQAMMNGADASKTAGEVLKKLENEGLSRQTIANAFTVEDFYGFADQYVPPENLQAAKVWLKEFHSAIQNPQSPQPLRTAGPATGAPGGAEPAPTKPTVVAASNGNGAAKSMAPSRDKTATRPARAQSREPAKNI